MSELPGMWEETDSAEQPTYAELLREQFSGNGRFEKAFTTNDAYSVSIY